MTSLGRRLYKLAVERSSLLYHDWQYNVAALDVRFRMGRITRNV